MDKMIDIDCVEAGISGWADGYEKWDSELPAYDRNRRLLTAIVVRCIKDLKYPRLRAECERNLLHGSTSYIISKLYPGIRPRLEELLKEPEKLISIFNAIEQGG